MARSEKVKFEGQLGANSSAHRRIGENLQAELRGEPFDSSPLWATSQK